MNELPHRGRISDPNELASAVKLVETLRSDGFAVLKSALPEIAVADAKKSVRRLFDLSRDKKCQFKATQTKPFGYLPYGSHFAKSTGASMMLETWDFSPDCPSSVPARMRDEWSSINFLYNLIVAQLSATLGLVELGLSLPQGKLTNLANSPNFRMQLICYPADLLGKVPNGERQCLHRDASVITIIPKTNETGLFIEKGGCQTRLDIKDNDLLVLVGYALEYATGGELQACLHGVDTPDRPNQSCDRFAMPVFSSLPTDVQLAPFYHDCLKSYPQISGEEFMKQHLPTTFKLE